MKPLPRFLKSPRTGVAIAALVVAYVAGGFLLVPRLVANAAHSFFETHYHRHIEIGRVAFNPLTLKLAVDKFVVPDADGAPMLAFDHLGLGLSLASLFRGGLDLGEVSLDRPRALLVRRADGRVNVMDLVPPPDPHSNPNAPPPRLWIHALAIRGGEASIVGQEPGGALHLSLAPISITLQDFSTRSEGNAYHVVASSSHGEQFDWRGTFGIQPLASKGSFKVSHLQVQTLSAIGVDLAPLELAGGEMGLDGRYDFAEQADKLSLQAQVTELQVTSLALRPTGEHDSWIVVPRLVATDTALDLAAATVRVGHVLVEAPTLKAWRDRDGSISLTRLAPAAGGAPSAGATARAGAPEAKRWQLAVPDIRVTGADVSLEDRMPARPASLHLAPLEFSVGGFASPAAGPLMVTLDTGVNDTGRLTANGSLTLQPLAGRFDVEARALALTAAQPYLERATALTISSGTASLKGAAIIGPAATVGFQGDAEVDDLRTVDNALGEDFVKWQSLRFNGVRAQSGPSSLSIREVVARQPFARVIIGSNGVTNLHVALRLPGPAAEAAPGTTATAAATPPPAPAPPEPAAAAAPVAPVAIGLVRISDGSMNFADFTVKPSFATGIHELAGTIKGLSSKPGARADVDLAGKVDRYAPMTITGEVNFLAAVAYTDVKMSFKNMELTGLSPYSGRFAGYQIDKGKMSADLSYHVENRVLTAGHKLSINQLQLGEHVDSPDATKLPVKFAIALLKDGNGVIDLELPVTGSLDDPEFSVGPIIWKLFVGLLTKAVTAPFKLLGALFGGNEELEFVDFPAGSAVLDAAGRAKLASLVKALAARPALNIDVPQVVAPAVDSVVIARQQWLADLDARARRRLGAHAQEPGAVERLLATPKDYRALLEDAYRDNFGHPAVLPQPAASPGTPPPEPQAAAIAWLEAQLKPLVVVGSLELAALADQRAAAVQSALLDGTGVDPTRVFVIKKAPIDTASAPVRMQLALH